MYIWDTLFYFIDSMPLLVHLWPDTRWGAGKVSSR